jgi:hypothetical protein
LGKLPERQIPLLPSSLLLDLAPANLPHGGFLLFHQPDHYDRGGLPPLNFQHASGHRPEIETPTNEPVEKLPHLNGI